MSHIKQNQNSDAEKIRYEYEVDASMLGSEFSGDVNSIREFCRMLEEEMPEIDVIAITDNYNGADNNTLPDELFEKIEQAFMRALDRHAESFPTDWSRN